MRNKKLLTVIIIALVFAGFILYARAKSPGTKSRRAASAVQAEKGSKRMSEQKVISNGNGALTIRIANSKNVEVPMRIKAFKVIDAGSSVYAASSVGGRTQELAPGVYDVEIDTVPQKIFKNIKVSSGKETFEDMGCVTGSLVVRTLNAKKTDAYYPMRIFYPKTKDMVTAYMTNKAIDMVPGVYDIEVGTSPRLYENGVKVGAGRETIIDMGCVVGSLNVKTVDKAGKNVRLSVRIKTAGTSEIVNSIKSNKPVDLLKGSYDIEVLSSPKQFENNVKVDAGKESVVKLTIKSSAGTSKRKSVARKKR
jgi:hypothetical protein